MLLLLLAGEGSVYLGPPSLVALIVAIEAAVDGKYFVWTDQATLHEPTVEHPMQRNETTEIIIAIILIVMIVIVMVAIVICT